MRRILIIIAVFFTVPIFAQLSDVERKKFSSAEDVLRVYTETFDNDSLSFEERVENIHAFIPRFIAILKERNSFYYSFDSLMTIHTIVAPDESFRIFTWQLKEPLGTHKYYGAIQMNTDDLKLFPLFDYSDTMTVYPQGILSPENWYGALYYNCILTEIDEKKVYTLFAYDEADFVSSRKFLEVLIFEEGKPFFGKESLFNYTDSTGVYIETKTRPFIEYNDKSSIGLNYNKEKELIIYDHTTAPTKSQDGARFTYIPDGTYEGFKWENNQWKWVEKIFHYSIGHPDNPPSPKPLFGDKQANPVFDD